MLYGEILKLTVQVNTCKSNCLHRDEQSHHYTQEKCDIAKNLQFSPPLVQLCDLTGYLFSILHFQGQVKLQLSDLWCCC